jgi:hypothetical protein
MTHQQLLHSGRRILKKYTSALLQVKIKFLHLLPAPEAIAILRLTIIL